MQIAEFNYRLDLVNQLYKKSGLCVSWLPPKKFYYIMMMKPHRTAYISATDNSMLAEQKNSTVEKHVECACRHKTLSTDFSPTRSYIYHQTPH